MTNTLYKNLGELWEDFTSTALPSKLIKNVEDEIFEVYSNGIYWGKPEKL